MTLQGQDQHPSAEPEPTREVAGDGDRRLSGVYPSPARLTATSVSNRDCDELLAHASKLPSHVLHAASVVRYSPDATNADRQLVADALNARRVLP